MNKEKLWRCLNVEHGDGGFVFKAERPDCPKCPHCGVEWPIIPADAKIEKIMFGANVRMET